MYFFVIPAAGVLKRLVLWGGKAGILLQLPAFDQIEFSSADADKAFDIG